MHAIGALGLIKFYKYIEMTSESAGVGNSRQQSATVRQYTRPGYDYSGFSKPVFNNSTSGNKNFESNGNILTFKVAEWLKSKEKLFSWIWIQLETKKFYFDFLNVAAIFWKWNFLRRSFSSGFFFPELFLSHRVFRSSLSREKLNLGLFWVIFFFYTKFK